VLPLRGSRSIPATPRPSGSSTPTCSAGTCRCSRRPTTPWLTRGAEGGIGGGIGDAQGPNQVVFYIEVDDPQAYLDRVENAGGTTVVPVTEIPDMVTFAQFADPQGNVIGLTKSA
jgi:predicted enzyme related to lactoylglutathione lyase